MSSQTICTRPNFCSVSKVSLPHCSCGLANIVNVAKTTSNKINQMCLVLASVMSFYLVCSPSLGTDIFSLAILHSCTGDAVLTMQLKVAWKRRRGLVSLSGFCLYSPMSALNYIFSMFFACLVTQSILGIAFFTFGSSCKIDMFSCIHL